MSKLEVKNTTALRGEMLFNVAGDDADHRLSYVCGGLLLVHRRGRDCLGVEGWYRASNEHQALTVVRDRLLDVLVANTPDGVDRESVVLVLTRGSRHVWRRVKDVGWIVRVEKQEGSGVWSPSDLEREDVLDRLGLAVFSPPSDNHCQTTWLDGTKIPEWDLR